MFFPLLAIPVLHSHTPRHPLDNPPQPAIVPPKDQRQASAARTHHEQALAIFEAKLPPTHPCIADLRQKISAVQAQMQKG
jgi:hypothetical protein